MCAEAVFTCLTLHIRTFFRLTKRPEQRLMTAIQTILMNVLLIKDVGNCHIFVPFLNVSSIHNFQDLNIFFSAIESLRLCDWFDVQYDIFFLKKRPLIFCWKSCVFNDHDCIHLYSHFSTLTDQIIIPVF